MNTYKYDKEFFDFVDRSSYLSAKNFIPQIYDELKPKSVLDIGCGRGIWLKVWKDHGVDNVIGIDGEYVDTNAIHVDQSSFFAKDLKLPFDLNTTFDLVECLEVAEHLPMSISDLLVENLIRHGDVILFSAAQKGQGGENHINEQDVDYWMKKFSAKGYHAFDYPRLQVQGIEEIEPWYRYNTVLYANDRGIERLPENIRKTLIYKDNSKEYMSTSWKIRCFALSHIPQFFVHQLAKAKHIFLNRRS